MHFSPYRKFNLKNLVFVPTYLRFNGSSVRVHRNFDLVKSNINEIHIQIDYQIVEKFLFYRDLPNELLQQPFL
jgi:hypothetical protein